MAKRTVEDADKGDSSTKKIKSGETSDESSKVQKKQWKVGGKREKGGSTFKKGKDGKRVNKDGTPLPEKEIAHNHKEQKELKRKRQAENKPNFEIIRNTKVLWEKVRSSQCPKAERPKLVAEILAMIEGKLHDVIFQHDSVRVIQCCVQFGSEETRTKIFDELMEHVLDLAKSKYGKFMIPKMLTYGSKAQRAQIISQFYGNVVKLIRNKTASPVVAIAYIDFATSEQRSSMLQEFYGPDFTLFKMTGNMKSLAEIFEIHPTKKPSILKHLRRSLLPLLEKGICSHHIVHRAISDYLLYAVGPERAEMLDTLRELLPEMIHTKEGARIAMISLWDADAKNRKLIVRAFKPYVSKICMEEYGHIAMLALFDAVDDTVLVTKQIIAPLTAELDEICQHRHGRKVLLYLLSPRNPRYFLPEVVELLKKGDGNEHSKKEASVKQSELRAAILAPMLKYVATDAAAMVEIGASSQVVDELLHAAGEDVADLEPCVEAVAKCAARGSLGETEATSDESSLMGHGVAHRLAKKLLQPACKSASLFGTKLYEMLEGTVAHWATSNRAAWVLSALVEGPNAEVAEAVSTELKASLQIFSGVELAGPKHLLEKLGASKKAKAKGGSNKTSKGAKVEEGAKVAVGSKKVVKGGKKSTKGGKK